MTERADTFDALYRATRDPWGYATSVYERDKYAATLAALPRDRYAAALEIGCSIGVMTRQLAARCDRLTAIDVSRVALATARENCAGLPVAFVCAEVPGAWPAGRFDLVVFSEVLYFLTADEVARCARLAAGNLNAGGDILLVNWLGPSDTALSGDAAAQTFLAAVTGLGFSQVGAIRAESYRIDLCARALSR